MTFTLAFDDGQRAIHDALAGFCQERADDAVGRMTWAPSLWPELGELGVFAACTPGGDGGALEIVAAMEALGAAGCPGPFAATYFATQCLDEATVKGVADGRAIVALGAGGIFPFGGEAEVFIEIEGDEARLGSPASTPRAIEQLGGDPAARVELVGAVPLEPLDRAHALSDIVRGARIASCGHALVWLASEHARTRKQFRKPIGEFQAVAHPLADSHMALSAATALARVAAYAYDHDGDVPTRTAAHARLSASQAGLDVIHVVHQVFGAVGITLEGPIYHLTRRLRQWIGDAPSLDHARERVLAGLGWSEAAGGEQRGERSESRRTDEEHR